MGSLEGTLATPKLPEGDGWNLGTPVTVQAEPLRPRGPPGVPVPKPWETTKEEMEAWEECSKSKGYLFY